MENLEINLKKKIKTYNVKIFLINIGIFVLLVLILIFFIMSYQLIFSN